MPEILNIEELHRFIDQETDKQIADVKAMWERPIHERVEEGEAIAYIKVELIEGESFLTHEQSYDLKKRRSVFFNFNNSKFRVGDSLILHQGDPKNLDESFKVEIEEEHENRFLLKPGYKESFKDLIGGEGWFLDRATIDVRFILKDAMDKLAIHPEGKNIEHICKGTAKAQLDPARLQMAESLCGALAFNPKQKEAFVNAYASNHYYLLQGPPGTGKTFVLAYLAYFLAQEGKRVLITALSHRAINNALAKIAKETRFPHLIKIGQYYNTEGLEYGDSKVRNYEYFNSSPYFPDTRGLIVGASPFACHGRRLNSVEFDVMIADEAGQLTFPLGLAAMLSAKKYVFIGDHIQMPPVLSTVHEPAYLNKSIFEHLFQYGKGTMLDTTYRMSAAINSFPSKTFYNGRLLPAPQVAQQTLSFSTENLQYPEVWDNEQAMVWVESPDKDSQIRSEASAAILSDLICSGIKNGLQPEQMAVVCPYRAQTSLLRSLIKKELHALGVKKSIMVDTVERIQGQEKDVIFYSLTTSDPHYAAGRSSFLFQPNRINVMLTRAKKKVIIVGNAHILSAQSLIPSEERPNFEIFKHLYEHCQKVVLAAKSQNPA